MSHDARFPVECASVRRLACGRQAFECAPMLLPTMASYFSILCITTITFGLLNRGRWRGKSSTPGCGRYVISKKCGQWLFLIDLVDSQWSYSLNNNNNNSNSPIAHTRVRGTHFEHWKCLHPNFRIKWQWTLARAFGQMDHTWMCRSVSILTHTTNFVFPTPTSNFEHI